MKKLTPFVLFLSVVCSCKKDEKLVKTTSYANLVYEIQTNQTDLEVTFRRGVYNDSIKGNIDYDTVFTEAGVHYISAQVLLGKPVVLFGMSHEGGDFHLAIKGENGAVITQTDTVAFYPANQLHEDQYVSRLEMTP